MSTITALRDTNPACAHVTFYRSARVAALGLDVLPRGFYIAHRVDALRRELNATRRVGGSLRRVPAHIEELRELLRCVLDVTAGVDLAGELGLPLEIVSAVQTGARSGLSALDRMVQAIDALTREGRPAEAGTADAQPSPLAQWLLNTGSGLLPVGSRDRFAEEFRSELFALTEGGAGFSAQLAHASRQVVRLWALRRALPRAVRAGDGGRVQATVRADRGAMVRTLLLDSLRAWFDDRLALGLLRGPSRGGSQRVYRRGARGKPGLGQAARPGLVPPRRPPHPAGTRPAPPGAIARRARHIVRGGPMRGPSIRSGGSDHGDLRARQKERFGGIRWGAAFFGWLTAIGTAVLLSALLTAIGGAQGLAFTGGGRPGGAQRRDRRRRRRRRRGGAADRLLPRRMRRRADGPVQRGRAGHRGVGQAQQ